MPPPYYVRGRIAVTWLRPSRPWQAPAAEVDAGGRAVRVSSPDRVIYEATEHTPEVTKLMVAEYFAPSATASCGRCVTGRPPWSAGRRACARASSSPPGRGTRPTRSTRSGCPRARPTTSRPRPSPSPRAAPPTRSAPPSRGAGVVRADGHAHLPSLAGPPRPTSTIPTSCGSTWTPSRARSFRDAVRVAGVARGLLEELGLGRVPEDERQPRRARLRPDRAAVGLRRRTARGDRLRPRAGAARRTG